MHISHLSGSQSLPLGRPARATDASAVPAGAPAPAAILELSPAARNAYDPLPNLPSKNPQPTNIIWGSGPNR